MKCGKQHIHALPINDITGLGVLAQRLQIGNPSGAVLPASYISDMLAFARRHDLYLLSDECYADR